MGRYALAGTSLVAAIPAAFLAYLAIMAWVRYTENMTTMVMVVNGGVTLISVLLALTPIIILVGRRRQKGPRADKSAAEEAGDKSALAAAAVSDDEVATAQAGEPLDVSDSSEFAEPAETDAFDFQADELEDVESASDDAFEFDDDERKT